uniref:early activation antigen CD69-like n=1 Tax=Euleptes europaea TaxID=460621 RepID=UPI00253FBF5A|nr:early activation antigen CD69-like [Euleptes europaea]
MNHVENPPEEIIALNLLNPENGQLNTALEQRRSSHNEGPGRNKQNAGRRKLKLDKKARRVIIVRIKQLQATTQESNATSASEQLQATPASKPCPQDWIMNAESCYFFSVTESTLESAYRNCSSSGGSLTVMRNVQEETFINKKKDGTEYWLGYRRESIGDPWKQPDESDFDEWFKIKGDGLCASLNDGVVSSTDCDSQISLRRWICKRPQTV